MAQKRALVLGKEARNFLFQGISQLSSAVKVTLGAEGKHVVIEDKKYPYPVITRDGVAVAESISFGDNRIEQGAAMAKDAARECWRVAGDGTTSTIVLTEALCATIKGYIDPVKEDTPPRRPNHLAQGVRQAAYDAIEAIKEISKPVNKQDLLDIAIISANNDVEMGNIVADIVWEVGENGSVVIKPGKDKTKVEVLQGTILKAGFLDPLYINTDIQSRSELEPIIFVTDFTFSKSADVSAILKAHVDKMGATPIIIIAKEFLGDAKHSFANTYVQHKFPIAIIEAPFEGEQMKDVLKDIAVATGATFLSESKGYAIGQMYEGSYFGKASRIEIYDDETRIVGGHGHQNDIKALVDVIQKKIDDCDNSDEENFLKERIAWLTGKVAVVSVGGSTPTEKISKLHRLDDSIRSSKAALDDGMVIGGGAAYLYAYTILMKKIDEWDSEYCDSDFYSGYESMAESLLYPISQILSNASLNPQEVDNIVDELLGDIKNGNMVTYNVLTLEKEPIALTHIFDSSKVVKTAILKASSVGAVFATTEVLNYDEFKFINEQREKYLP